MGIDRVRLTFGVRVENKQPKRVWLYYSSAFWPDESGTVSGPAELEKDPRWQAFEGDLRDQLYPEIAKYVSGSIQRQSVFTTSKPYTVWVRTFVFADERCGKIMSQSVNDTKSGIVASLAIGDGEGVRLALQAGEDVNAVDEDGDTPLLFATKIQQGSGLIQLLLKGGADPNVSDREGRSPLEWASIGGEKGAVDSVRVLLDAGAHVDHQNTHGQTALEHACFGSDFARDVAPTLLQIPATVKSVEDRADIVRLLIAKGANVNLAADDGSTPLHWAASWGDVDITKQLLAAGADPNARDKNGDRPLEKAARQCIDGRGDTCREALKILQPVTK